VKRAPDIAQYAIHPGDTGITTRGYCWCNEQRGEDPKQSKQPLHFEFLLVEP